MLSLYDNHEAEKERFWRNKKNEKYSQENVYIRIAYNSFCVISSMLLNICNN